MKTYTMFVWKPVAALTVEEAAALVEARAAGPEAEAPELGRLAQRLEREVPGSDRETREGLLVARFPEPEAADACGWLVEAADEAGLVVFDPQNQELYWPSDESFLPPGTPCLELQDGSLYLAPNPEWVCEALRDLVEASDQDEPPFLILKSGRPGWFLQALCLDATDWQLEYQEGSLEAHFVCTDDRFGVEDLEVAFADYLAGGQAWKTSRSWERVDFEDE